MHIAHDAAADEDVLDGAQVRVPQLLRDRDVLELDVEVLVDRLERARDLDVVLELDRDGVVYERLEEAVVSLGREVVVSREGIEGLDCACGGMEELAGVLNYGM